MCKQRQIKVFCCAFLLLITLYVSSSDAVEISGEVVAIENAVAKIKYDSDYAPNVGDKVKIGYVDEDGDFVRIRGSWEIVDVDSDFTWAENTSNKPGTPKKNHLAKVQSENPKLRSELAKMSKSYDKGNSIPTQSSNDKNQWDKEDSYDAEQLYQKGLDYKNKKKHEEAAQWFRKAADNGHAKAQLELHWIYLFGTGVSQDKEEANKWIFRAANQGLAEAQSSLGYSYLAIARDYVNAEKWYRKAAEQGHAQAQYKMGVLYYYKYKGIRHDCAEGIKWYKKAANNGYSHAQWTLGDLYERGENVPKDIDEAIKWYKKAARNGDEGARELLKKRGLKW